MDGEMPSPKKEIVGFETDEDGRVNVMLTMIGPRELGTRWRVMMRRSVAPSARAASTNSFSFRLSTVPRTIRAVLIQPTKVKIVTISRKLPGGPRSLAAHS